MFSLNPSYSHEFSNKAWLKAIKISKGAPGLLRNSLICYVVKHEKRALKDITINSFLSVNPNQPINVFMLHLVNVRGREAQACDWRCLKALLGIHGCFI